MRCPIPSGNSPVQFRPAEQTRPDRCPLRPGDGRSRSQQTARRGHAVLHRVHDLERLGDRSPWWGMLRAAPASDCRGPLHRCLEAEKYAHVIDCPAPLGPKNPVTILGRTVNERSSVVNMSPTRVVCPPFNHRLGLHCDVHQQGKAPTLLQASPARLNFWACPSDLWCTRRDATRRFQPGSDGGPR